jgi:uncharacterized protein
MDERSPRRGVNLALVAIGLALGGWFIGNGFASVRAADRFVTVKGVAEREVKADLALWPIGLAATDNDLSLAQSRINQNVAKVMAFLVANGVDTTEAALQGLRVTDRLANPYGAQERIGSRFVIQQTVMVRSENPERIRATSQRVGELVNAGVVLQSGEEYGAGGPTYLFKRLNDVKPSMIAEATAEARKAAEQFAKDSKSHLGGIRHASQGVFSILPRDEAPGINEQSQILKTVRVVTTVEYLLKN